MCDQVSIESPKTNVTRPNTALHDLPNPLEPHRHRTPLLNTNYEPKQYKKTKNRPVGTQGSNESIYRNHQRIATHTKALIGQSIHTNLYERKLEQIPPQIHPITTKLHRTEVRQIASPNTRYPRPNPRKNSNNVKSLNTIPTQNNMSSTRVTRSATSPAPNKTKALFKAERARKKVIRSA